MLTGNSVTALCLLCYLLQDSRSKPDHKRIILFCDVSKTDNVRITRVHASAHGPLQLFTTKLVYLALVCGVFVCVHVCVCKIGMWTQCTIVIEIAVRIFYGVWKWVISTCFQYKHLGAFGGHYTIKIIM